MMMENIYLVYQNVEIKLLQMMNNVMMVIIIHMMDVIIVNYHVIGHAIFV